MIQSNRRTENLLTVADLTLTLRQVGKPGVRPSPFRGRNDVQGGGGDVGTLPGSLPGHQGPTNDEVDEKFAEVWGEYPPAESGLRVSKMPSEAHEGDFHGMYIVREDPTFSESDI